MKMIVSQLWIIEVYKRVVARMGPNTLRVGLLIVLGLQAPLGISQACHFSHGSLPSL